MDNVSLEGRMFAHYRVEQKLGQGGMGVVYRAQDTRLHRPVAIKFLGAHNDEMDERRERFLQEARSASALNHPNIITIYETGQHEDTDFIAMEFVPGKTLHDLIHKTGLSLSDTLKYAVQIADAMAAAHAAGVVHRDLKPANILVTERGQVKIVDFGLAKRLGRMSQDDATRTMQAQTRDGLTVGTVSYMSPEQAEGKGADARSDIFAFGAILYEMVTGRRAFQGDNPISTLVAVASREPAPIQWPGAGSNELDRIIRRCLRKDPERRAQHAGDLRLMLEDVRDTWEHTHVLPPTAAAPSSGSSAAAPALAAVAPVDSTALSTGLSAAASPSPRRALWTWWAGGAAVAIAAGIGALALRPAKAPEAPTAPMALKRITSDGGLSSWPALSPDGKLVAYSSDRGEEDHVHIWLQQIGGGAPIRLTSGAADDTEASFSPDGTKVVYHSDREGGGVYVVPALGGEARLVAANGRGPRFSPDGSQILYWEGGDMGRIAVVDSGGGAPRPLQGKFHSARYPVWSPDGKWVLASAYHLLPAPGDHDWWAIPTHGGEPVKTGVLPALAQQNLRATSTIGVLAPAAWLPDGRALFAARSNDAVSIWAIALDPETPRAAGPARPITEGTQDGYPSAAADERGLTRLAYASLTRKINLWKLTLDQRTGAATGTPERITRSGNDATQVSMSADGKRIAYLWDRDGGKPTVWVRDMESGRQIEVPGPSSKDSAQWVPSITPDGAAVAWSVYEKGRITETYLTRIKGETPGPPELLCRPCGSVSGWSPGGQTAFYSDTETVLHGLDLASRKDYELLRRPGGSVWGARPSPDNRWLVFNVTTGVSESRLYAAPFDAERPRLSPIEEWIPLTDGAHWDDKPRWSADGRAIYFLSSRDGFRCVWRQALDPATRQPKGAAAAVAHFHGARLSMMNVSMGPLSIAAGPNSLVVSLAELTGEIWTATPQK